MEYRTNLQKNLETVREAVARAERTVIHTAVIPDKETLRLIQKEIEFAIDELGEANEELNYIISDDEPEENEEEEWPPCEKCGKPSEHMVNDIERYPNNHGLIETKPSDDSPHYFCNDHNRNSITYCFGWGF